MKLLTTYELHYVQYKDAFFDPTNLTGSSHFNEQLAVFDELTLVARCKKVQSDPNCQRVDSERIRFLPVCDFNGYKDIRKKYAAFWQCRKAVGLADRYWLRAPGFMASMVGFWLRQAGIPYFSHLVGNIGEVAELMMDRFPKPIAKLARLAIEIKFKRYMNGCHGNLSVTEHLLNRLYPSALACNDFGVSDVRLTDSVFCNVERDFNSDIFNIVNIAAMLPYKGHRFLFEALAKIKAERNWSLHLIGDGSAKLYLQQLASSLGISDKIVFHGHLQWDSIVRILDSSHLFVLSSLTEGMPRVVLEAMARGLPAISTNVGGVHEVIQPEWLVRIKNPDELAYKISSIWKNPVLLRNVGLMNYEKIQDFRLARLSRLRENWLTWMKLHGDQADKVTWNQFANRELQNGDYA